MNPKEKFDVIIDEIERLVQGVKDQDGDIIYYDKQEICERAFNKAQCYISTAREKNALFQFLLSKNVYEYITDRKLMAAYDCLLGKGVKEGYLKAMEIVGSATQAGFIRLFKSRFLLTPDVAVKRNDYSLLLPKPSWEQVSGKDLFMEQIDRMKAHYRLNDRECALAIELNKKYGFKLDEVFGYIYNYVWGYIEGDERFNKDRDTDIEYYLSDENVLRMYFEYRFSMDMILGLLVAKAIGMIDRDLRECDREFLEGCAMVVYEAVADNWAKLDKYNCWLEPYETKYSFYSFYEENYQYYMENRDERYTCYDYLLYAVTSYYDGKEDAFACLEPGLNNYDALIIKIGSIKELEESVRSAMREMEDDDYRFAMKEMAEREKMELYGEVYEYEQEDYYLSSMEMDFYNPDFGEEGYAVSYDSDDTSDYDYEPDLDNPEWRANCFLDEVEEQRFESGIDVIKNEDIILEEQNQSADNYRTEDDFEKLCKEFNRNEMRARLSRHANFNVREYLDKQRHMWEARRMPF